MQGRINGIASIIIDGEEKRARCSAWGRISGTGGGLPCLVLENSNNGNPEYTVVAVSFGNKGTERRWTCISPMFLRQAIRYFLENNQMGNMVEGGNQVSSLPETEICGSDYRIGDVCIEVQILRRNSNAISACNRWSLNHAIRQTEQHYKKLTAMQETGEKMILLLVNQYGKEGEEGILSSKKVSDVLARMIQDGVEIWIASLEFTADGILLADLSECKGYDFE